MAEVIRDEEWPSDPWQAGVYPWDEWLDGQPRRLRRGVDFEALPSSFRGAAAMAATRRRVKIRTRTVGDEVFLQRI